VIGCGTRSCGCALRSDTLAISGSGTAASPWKIDITTPGGQLIETSHVDAAARDAAYPLATRSDGQTAWLRNTKQKTRWNTVEWLVMEEPWTTFTPTWTATGTTPAIGNGNLHGRYQRVGKTCHIRMHLVSGSSTTWGSGFYRLALPFTGSSVGTGTEQYLTLKAYNSVANYFGIGHIPLGQTYVELYVQSAVGEGNNLYLVSDGSPAAWINPSNIHLTGTYEIA